ncbi:MAG: hypothetical protein M1368_12695 [Thaumarchaeota archaeon]|nr:hypothetical protein [Nitrososphaerota archaeon]
MNVRTLVCRPMFDDPPGRIAIALVLVIFISVIFVVPIIVLTQPHVSNTIPITVDSKGGFFQNLTISCYGCVPDNQYVWTANLTIPTTTGPVKIPITARPYNGSGFLSFYFAIGVQITANSPCNSVLETNTTCIYPLHFPFSFSFNIDKTSKGGTLQTIVYLPNNVGFALRTTSGSISKNLTYQAGQAIKN